VGAAAARGGLAAASVPYAAAVNLRRCLYHKGVLRRYRAAVPVISVGNITTGGTGKTPMVAWIVRELIDAGARPAVLMRGYKAAGGVSDEAELLKRLTGCEVLADADRVAAAGRAASGGADVLVMDDGFQHLRLGRDLDVVLIDTMNPFGYGRVLPRGLLREPVAALRDAGAIVLTRCNGVTSGQIETLDRRLGELAPRASRHRALHRAVMLIDPSGAQRPLRALAGRRVMAFCGIGNPEAFFATVDEVGVDPVACVALADHEAYGRAVLDRLRQAARACKAESLLTTEKDHVKLAAADLGSGVWRLVVAMEVVHARDELIERIRGVLRR